MRKEGKSDEHKLISLSFVELLRTQTSLSIFTSKIEKLYNKDEFYSNVEKKITISILGKNIDGLELFCL